MKLTVDKPTEIEAAAIRCVLPVNYDEEDMPNDFPFRKGDVWDITIDIATGKIFDWPGGKATDLYMKVVDGGSYYLLGHDKHVLACREQEYVPKCVPGEYGDYVDFKIDAAGFITNWKTKATPDRIASAFFDSDD